MSCEGLETFTRLPTRLWCLLLWVILTFLFILCAQAVSDGRAAGSSFISPDGRFRFEYSNSLVSCRRDPNQVNSWVQDQGSYGLEFACSEDGSCLSRQPYLRFLGSASAWFGSASRTQAPHPLSRN